MIGNAGSNDVNVYQYGYGLIFDEHAYNYFHTITVSSANSPNNKDSYPAFYSRNVSIMGLAHSNTN